MLQIKANWKYVHIIVLDVKDGKVKVLVAQSCLLFETPQIVAHQAPLSMGFSRQEYWSGLPSPSPGDVPDPGIEPRSPELQAECLPFEPPRKRKMVPKAGRTCAKEQIATCQALAESETKEDPMVPSHVLHLTSVGSL